jgi:hypothetical protein
VIICDLLPISVRTYFFNWTDILSFALDFEWNEGNIRKNWERHGVSHIECGEIFFNKPIIIGGCTFA